MTRFVAVRHGETDWNRNARLQGWAPTPLNERGHEQAVAAGEWIASTYDVNRVVTSDLTRCRETTDRILEAVGDRPVEYDEAWRERDLGVYQGLTYAEVEERFPVFGLAETAYEAPDRTPEGGESLRDVANRVTASFERLVDGGTDETVLVVTHGGPLGVLLGHVKDVPLPEALANNHPRNCAVTELLVRDGDRRVLRENATDWLDED